MQLTIFAIVLVAGLVASAISLRLAMTRSTPNAVQFATVTGAASGIMWLLVTVGAFNVETISNGSTITRAYPSLGVVGVLGVGLSVLVVYKGSIEALSGR